MSNNFENQDQKINENSQGVTKVLLVTGDDDFHANSFAQEHCGTPVEDIIDALEVYESDEWELEVFTFDCIDPKFVEFIKEYIQDYDQSKTTNFYLDTDTIEC